MKKLAKFMSILLISFIVIRVITIEPTKSQYNFNRELPKQISSNMPGYTKIDEIPTDLKNAFIAVEDKRFFKHFGFDFIGIGRAAINNLKSGHVVEGGSTITQQLAKNLFLSDERSFSRKFDELFYALKLEALYSKEEILEMYLNVIYFGSNAYGIESASKIYFNKSVSDLTLKECAMLAGIPQAPSIYNPIANKSIAMKRQQIVLEVMNKNGVNTENKLEDMKVENRIFIK